MKSYAIKPTGRSEIAATLARFCAPGKFGAPLVERGFSQALFAACLAKWAKAVSASLTDAELASALEGLSACNASAARQALEACELDLGETTDAEWAAHGGRWVAGGKEIASLDKLPKDAKRVTPLTLRAWWAHLSPSATAVVDTSKLGF